MKTYSFTLLMIVALLLASCNAAPTATPTLRPLPTATEEASPTPVDTSTPAPTDVPTPAPTATSSLPMVSPSKDPVNCRFGPSTDYAMVGGLKVGESTQVFGKTSDAAWWQVQNPDATDQKCFVAASITTTSGDFSGISVVAAPETFVTAVTLALDPETITLTACSDTFDPIMLSGTIDVNGPAVVTWYFETEQGGKMPEQTLEFTAFGPQDVSEEFMPAPVKKGSYWVRLVVTSPNEVTKEVRYTIECP